MFLCYTHLKEDQTAKSYSLHTVGQPFWARSISNVPLPKLAVSSKHLPTATRQREWEGKGFIRCVCVCVCVRACVCVCTCACVCKTP